MFVLLLLVGAAHAEDNVPVTISGITSNNAGANYIVGDIGTNNSLTISDGGILTNVNYSYIGNQASASNNWAVITGTGSRWYCTNAFYVGYYGSGNTLTIADGAVLTTGNSGFLGYQLDANSNVVVVSGAVWTNASNGWYGRYGSYNSVIISNGATVFNNFSFIGYFVQSVSNNVTVNAFGVLVGISL